MIREFGPLLPIVNFAANGQKEPKIPNAVLNTKVRLW